MTVDVFDSRNEKVGALEISDEVFGGRVNTHVIWEAVVHQNAADRRGTHGTKTRAQVRGGGKKPWRQKGTGRARVGSSRNPLWRTGGIVFGPQPRDYSYRLPKKVVRGGLRAALTQSFQDKVVMVVEQLALEQPRTRNAVELLDQLDLGRKTLLVDVSPDVNLSLAVRNLADVRILPANRLSARDVVDANRVVITRGAVERLERVLAS